MAKLSDLPLRDDPPREDNSEAAREAREDRARERDQFVTQCEFLLDDERFKFAWDTVGSMRDRVRDEKHQPTERMWQAVKNIEAGGRRQAKSLKNWGRRYEGR